MQNIYKPLPAVFLLILVISGCSDRSTEQAPLPPAPLPHLRYFESTFTENEGKLFILFDYDIATETKQEIWRIADSNIDRVEITPDGNYVLVHYSILEELSQYYIIYNLASVAPDEPMVFYRDEIETEKVSAYEAFLNFGTYNYGFVIGDPDFEAYAAKKDEEVYQFAWVSLIAGVVEDILLFTTMDNVPEILYLPEQGGYFDFFRPGEGDILRLMWDTSEVGFIYQLVDKEADPLRLVLYIGSFNLFADFKPPPRSELSSEPMRVGIRSKDNLAALNPGDFPLWSLYDRYILLRVIPPEVLERMISGQNPLMTWMEMAAKGERGEFAVYDVEAGERRDIALETVDPMAMPKPPFDPLSDLIAVVDLGPIPIDETPPDDPDAVGEASEVTIIIFDVSNDKVVATIEGIPGVADTAMAFYRPEE
jgi:hypothetical protein